MTPAKWLHQKVWLVWGRWWAVQVVLWLPEFSLGFHVEPKRPLLDIYLPWVTIALGDHPVWSDARYKHLHRGRGMLYGTLTNGRWPEDAF